MKKYNITVNGTTYEVLVEEVNANNSYTPAVNFAPKTSTPASKPASNSAAGGTNVCAPMPGTILDVKVAPGKAIKNGEVVCVLEAMKMENDRPSPCDGVVSSVLVQKGSSVATNDVIITIK